MRPAFDSQKGSAMKIVAQHIRQAIARIAKRGTHG
jgi:hypothetical protein